MAIFFNLSQSEVFCHYADDPYLVQDFSRVFKPRFQVFSTFEGQLVATTRVYFGAYRRVFKEAVHERLEILAGHLQRQKENLKSLNAECVNGSLLLKEHVKELANRFFINPKSFYPDYKGSEIVWYEMVFFFDGAFWGLTPQKLWQSEDLIESTFKETDNLYYDLENCLNHKLSVLTWPENNPDLGSDEKVRTFLEQNCDLLTLDFGKGALGINLSKFSVAIFNPHTWERMPTFSAVQHDFFLDDLILRPIINRNLGLKLLLVFKHSSYQLLAVEHAGGPFVLSKQSSQGRIIQDLKYFAEHELGSLQDSIFDYYAFEE